MDCSVCKKKAVIEIRGIKKAFCKEHFIESFETRVKNYLDKHKMVEKNDKIAVGVSGGKDSLSLLYLLQKWYPEKVFAISIDEGIRGYRKNTLDIVERYVDKWGIELHKFSFKKEFGYSLDDMVRITKGLPCSLCGVFRRYLLNKKSREKGATKIAIGHNLDDEAQSILMNLFQHDTQRFLRMGPKSGNKTSKKFVPRIKPLRMVSEKETRAYFFLKGFPHDIWECPYMKTAFRDIVRNLLNNYEKDNPGTKINIVSAYDSFVKNIKKPEPKINLCKKCKEPSSLEICRACQILGKINEKSS